MSQPDKLSPAYQLKQNPSTVTENMVDIPDAENRSEAEKALDNFIAQLDIVLSVHDKDLAEIKLNYTKQYDSRLQNNLNWRDEFLNQMNSDSMLARPTIDKEVVKFIQKPKEALRFWLSVAKLSISGIPHAATVLLETLCTSGYGNISYGDQDNDESGKPVNGTRKILAIKSYDFPPKRNNSEKEKQVAFARLVLENPLSARFFANLKLLGYGIDFAWNYAISDVVDSQQINEFIEKIANLDGSRINEVLTYLTKINMLHWQAQYGRDWAFSLYPGSDSSNGVGNYQLEFDRQLCFIVDCVENGIAEQQKLTLERAGELKFNFIARYTIFEALANADLIRHQAVVMQDYLSQTGSNHGARSVINLLQENNKLEFVSKEISNGKHINYQSILNPHFIDGLVAWQDIDSLEENDPQKIILSKCMKLFDSGDPTEMTLVVEFSELILQTWQDFSKLSVEERARNLTFTELDEVKLAKFNKWFLDERVFPILRNVLVHVSCLDQNGELDEGFIIAIIINDIMLATQTLNLCGVISRLSPPLKKFIDLIEISSYDTLDFFKINQSNYQEFINNKGKVLPSFYDELVRWLTDQNTESKLIKYKLKTILRAEDIASLPMGARLFWSGFLEAGCTSGVNDIMLANKDNPAMFTEQGPTTAWYELLLSSAEQLASHEDSSAPYYPFLSPEELLKKNLRLCEMAYLGCTTKSELQRRFGKKLIDKLGKVMPKVPNDEWRNAFLHTPYDRVSQFFITLIKEQYKSEFSLTEQDLQIATDFIETYGLAVESDIFYYYKQTWLNERGLLSSLPQELVLHKISSTQELNAFIKRISSFLSQDSQSEKNDERVIDTDPLTEQIIALECGYYEHQFNKHPMDDIISRFELDLNAGIIKPIPPGYSVMEIDGYSSSQKIDLRAEQDFLVNTYSDIQFGIDHADDFESLRRSAMTIFEAKMSRLKSQTSHESKELFDSLDHVLRQCEVVTTPEELIQLLISSYKTDSSLQKAQSRLVQKIVFSTVFRHPSSTEYASQIEAVIKDPNSSEALRIVLDLVKNVILDHVLTRHNEDSSTYWKEEFFDFLHQNSEHPLLAQFRSLHKALVDAYRKVQPDENKIGAKSRMKIIPDRGFSGELSAYFGHACYSSKEFPLVSKWPNLVPYKIVDCSERREQEVIGSVLVFEVNQSDGKKALLIRAFNIPNELQVSAPDTFEKFADSLVETARIRGATNILVAGTAGTATNYPLAWSHIYSKYVDKHRPQLLEDSFSFNDIDITYSCYKVRSID